MANENEEFEFRLRAEQEAARAPATAAPSQPKRTLAGSLGVGEPILETVTGGMAAVPAGLAGLGAEAANLFGANIDDADVVRRVQDYLTYHPTTEAGRAVSDVVNEPMEKYGEATQELGGRVTDITGSPTLGMGVKTAADFVPGVVLGEVGGRVGRAAGRRIEGMRARNSQNAVRNQTMDAAQRAGYVLPPSEAGGPVGQAIESGAGKPKIERMASEKNQETTDRLTRLSLGLDPDAPLSMENVQRVRDNAGRIYERLAETGDIPWDQQYIDSLANVGERFAKIDRAFPDEPGVAPLETDRSKIERLKGKYFQQRFTAREAIDAIRELRADATNSFAKRDPVMGSVQREIANVLEERLGRHAAEVGRPELAQQFQDARRLIARTIAVEDALNTATGHVSAPRLGQMLDGGVPLDGELALIANTHNAFRRSLQHIEKQGKEGHFTPIEVLVAAGAYGHNPALAATAMARPLARAALTSRAGSRMMSAGPEAPGPVTRAAAGLQDPATGQAAALATSADVAAQNNQQ